MQVGPQILAIIFAALPVTATACGWWGDDLGDTSAQATIVGGSEDRRDLSTPQGMASMSRAYRTGDGVPQDDMVARRWARMAAEAGHVGAMNDFAQMLEFGIGGPEDAALAAAWYEKAAMGGDAAAMHSLAHMYFEGRGVPVDADKAETLLRRASANGHAAAAAELADMIWRGDVAAREAHEGCLWRLVSDARDPGNAETLCRAAEPGLDDTSLEALRARAGELSGLSAMAANSGS